MELLPLILLAPLLAYMAYCDMRFMRIPNSLVLAMLLIFVLTAPLLPMDSILARLAAASVVFVIGFATFAVRLFGGGDVKALSALILFLPPHTWLEFCYVFSIAMLVGMAFIVTLRAAPRAQTSSWVSMRARGMFPMGVSIALAGLMHPFLVAQLVS